MVTRFTAPPEGPREWAGRACAGVELEVFFPSANDRKAIAEAKRVCVGCPVVARCAAWALAVPPLTSCVVASVWMPPVGESSGQARKQLRRVAGQPIVREVA